MAYTVRRRDRRGKSSFRQAQTGGAALEFALISPFLIMILAGVTLYGGYFWLSHSLQQLVNDAARATVAGLTDDERLRLARQTLDAEVGAYAALDPGALDLSVVNADQTVTVRLAYDDSSNPIWALRGLVPAPSPTIVRSAAIHLGGL